MSTDGAYTITFDIPITDTNYGHNTAGVWTIVLTKTLQPSVIDDIVDGTTQATNILSDTNPYGPEIEISGEGQPSASGQSCWGIGTGNVIKGLAINRCPAYGLTVSGDDNRIIGNYIGTDATGSVDVSPTNKDGILLAMDSKNNTIGGPSEAERNIISGMGGGIRVSSAGSTGNVIKGNYIGTDRTGTVALGNGYGIKIHADAHDNTIGPNNVIAYNGTGVWVDGAGTDANTITHNSVHSNGDLGIDLTMDGNDLLPAPVISSTTCASAVGSTLITTTVELFTGPDDEGKTYLTTVSPDGSGNWSASGFLADDTYLTATATDVDGNTSQFSGAVPGCDRRTYAPLVMKNH